MLAVVNPHTADLSAPAADADLMVRVAAGDRAAYGVLVTRYLHKLLTVAERVVRRRAEAEEIVQEVFIKVWMKAGEWKAERGAVSTWLYRIALNQALDSARKRRYQPLPEDYDPPDLTPSAPEQLIAAEKRQILNKEMEKLPERQRAALVLSYHGEVSDAEAAVTMGVSVKAYESLLVRGRKTLRERLSAGGWHEA